MALSAKIYINHGRVIVDCPAQCNNSYAVRPKMTKAACTASDGCGIQFDLEFPEDLDALVKELRKRPNTANRNWFPEDHPLAIRARLPMGQTVADLQAEFAMNSEA